MSEVKFKVKKRLTRPLLKFVDGATRYVRIVSAVVLGKEMKAKEGEKKREPAHICDVINLETGEEAQIIASAVVASVFADEYPGDTYVGKCFAITKLGRVAGKQYMAFDVAEIEDPASSPAPDTTKPKK